MLKGKRSLQVISGALAASGAGTTLVSANPPQKEQKNGGVDNTRNLKGYKYEDVLKGTVIALIASTGIGLIFLTVWAFVHKYVAKSDLEGIINSYEKEKQNLENTEKPVIKMEKSVIEKEINKLKDEIKSINIVGEDGKKIDSESISIEELDTKYQKFKEKNGDAFKEYDAEMQSIKKDKESFLKLLEDNKEDLKVLGFDVENFKNRKDFTVDGIFDLFLDVSEKAGLFNLDYIDTKVKELLESFLSNHQDFLSKNKLKESEFKKKYFSPYVKGRKDVDLTFIKTEELRNEIEKCKDDLTKHKKLYKDVFEDEIMASFEFLKREVENRASFFEEGLLKKRDDYEKLLKKKKELEEKLASFEKITQKEGEMEQKEVFYKEAKRRKESLENSLWNFGNNFFKLHGNEDLMKLKLSY